MVEKGAGGDAGRTGKFRNEVEGLKKLNFARSGSVSSVSSARISPCLTGGRAGGRPPYPISAAPVSPLGPKTLAPG